MSTFAQIRDRAQNMALTEDSTTAGALVNDVYRDIVHQAQLKCGNTIESLVQGQNLYTLSASFGITDLGMVQYMMYKPLGETQGYVLEPSDLETVLQLSSTSPTGYVRKYAFQGLDNVFFWPSPQTTGDVLTIYYTQDPATLSADGDIPVSVPSQWHHIISVGAAARLCDAVGEDINLSNALQARYDVLFTGFLKWVKNRQGRGTQVMQSGYIRSAGFPNHNRSAYYSSMGND